MKGDGKSSSRTRRLEEMTPRREHLWKSLSFKRIKRAQALPSIPGGNSDGAVCSEADPT
jgi:hypothetical protein